jgi:hypothetical protein
MPLGKPGPKTVYGAFLGHDLSTHEGARFAFLTPKVKPATATSERKVKFNVTWSCISFRDALPVEPRRFAMHKTQEKLAEIRAPHPDMQVIDPAVMPALNLKPSAAHAHGGPHTGN